MVAGKLKKDREEGAGGKVGESTKKGWGVKKGIGIGQSERGGQ